MCSIRDTGKLLLAGYIAIPSFNFFDFFTVYQTVENLRSFLMFSSHYWKFRTFSSARLLSNKREVFRWRTLRRFLETHRVPSPSFHANTFSMILPGNERMDARCPCCGPRHVLLMVARRLSLKRVMPTRKCR